MRNGIKITADINFNNNLKTLFPNSRSTRERTKELNEILEEIIYGKKNRKKRSFR